MGYSDLHDHLKKLEASGYLRRIQRVINKDTELHPLVRWQYRGGIPEEDRKAWLFENVTDARGRRYKFPVVRGGRGSPVLVPWVIVEGCSGSRGTRFGAAGRNSAELSGRC